MKRIVLATVLACAAMGASADVTVYGRLDTGLLWNNTADTDIVTMESGIAGASRLGFKGSEKINDDLTVGFVLESTVKADTGEAFKSGFDRDCYLYINTNYGNLRIGRSGALGGGVSGGMFAGKVSPFGVVYKAAASTEIHAVESRFDNMVRYDLPKMGGLKLAVQVASGTEADKAAAWKLNKAKDAFVFDPAVAADRAGAEYSHDADMYYGVGAKYQAGAFGANLVVSTTEFKAGEEDLNVVAGVNYNFGVAKVWLAGNYYESGVKGHDHYGVAVSAAAPMFGGELSATVGYGEDGYAAAEDKEVYMVGAAYKYPLSKQTYLYAAAGFDQAKQGKAEVKTTEAMFGMVHNF